MATTSTNINVRVDSEVKRKSQELFVRLGMDMTSAINIFLRQAIWKDGIPFEIVGEQKPKRRNPPQAGCLKGKIWESDDHDWFEPLKDFEEYM